jgi:hypothetical protein
MAYCVNAGLDKDATDDHMDPAACLPGERRIVGMLTGHILNRRGAGGQGKTSGDQFILAA